MLFRATIADHGSFDFGRRVLGDGQPRFNGRQHRHAARMTQDESASRVGGVKNVLDGHALGTMLREERRELAVDDQQLIGKRGAGPGLHGAAPYQLMDAAVAVDAAVSGAVGAGVDAEDPHASEASISFSSMSKFDQTCLTSS